MSTYQAEASHIIPVPPAQVYAIISDYNDGHQAILPRRYFTEMIVTEGGQGAGTVIIVHMNVFGMRVTYNMKITEPEPGRVLQETDTEAGVVTTFTLDPVQNGQHTRVTIATEGHLSPGIKGWVEKLTTPPITRKVFREELQQIADVVQQRAGDYKANTAS